MYSQRVSPAALKGGQESGSEERKRAGPWVEGGHTPSGMAQGGQRTPDRGQRVPRVSGCQGRTHRRQSDPLQIMRSPSPQTQTSVQFRISIYSFHNCWVGLTPKVLI